MTKPIQIGEKRFESKKDARAHIRQLLDDAAWGTPLAGEEHAFVLSLLHRHPRATEKIGSGVSYFTVNSDSNGDRCFYLHRDGGVPEHFSYLKSLNGKDDVRALALGALNRAVDEQIWAFRDGELAKGPQLCPYTGKLITKDAYHVDHPNPTFLELHTEWTTRSGLGYEDIKISAGQGNDIGRFMTDPEQRSSWQQFHREHARLRLLSPRGNMSDAKIEANIRIKSKKSNGR